MRDARCYDGKSRFYDAKSRFYDTKRDARIRSAIFHRTLASHPRIATSHPRIAESPNRLITESRLLRDRCPSAETQDPVASYLQCACAKSMIPCKRDSAIRQVGD